VPADLIATSVRPSRPTGFRRPRAHAARDHPPRPGRSCESSVPAATCAVASHRGGAGL